MDWKNYLCYLIKKLFTNLIENRYYLTVVNTDLTQTVEEE